MTERVGVGQAPQASATPRVAERVGVGQAPQASATSRVAERVGVGQAPQASATSRVAQRYVYHCTLRWSDLDAYGHINNARFLTLYEEARVALMFALGRAWGVGSFADGVVIRRHEVDYLRPVDYALGRETAERAPAVRIELWVEDIRPSRFTVGYELFDKDVLAGRAKSVLVPFDLRRQRPRRLTEAERAFLLPYLHEPSAAACPT